MKKIVGIFLILITLLVSTPASAKTLESLFYYFPNEKGLKSFKKNYRDIDVIAPQVYTVGFDMKIKEQTKEERKFVRDAKKKKKVEVMPLIVNDQFNMALMSTLLNQPEAQDGIIDFMIKEADDKGYVGWQFDFENLNHLDRDKYVAFVKKTYDRLKEENLKFSVAVIVRGNDYSPFDVYQDWSSAYDYQKLAENSDFLSLMTYDDPNSLGPTASILYVRYILDYMVKIVPRDKISLGIPLYCWKWTGGVKTRSTTYDISMEEYDEGINASKGYDSILGNEWIKWTNKDNGKEYIAWCDGYKGLKEKISLIREYDLRGFSAWAIGQENKYFWKAI